MLLLVVQPTVELNSIQQLSIMRVHKQAFATLQWYSHIKSKRRSILKGAVARLRSGILGHAFDAMRTYASNKTFKETKVVEVILFWRTNIVKAAFARWQHLADQKRDLNEKVSPRGFCIHYDLA